MLNFYLTGIARSGTSAGMDILNLHSNIFVGTERFATQTPPDHISFPGSFETNGIDTQRGAFVASTNQRLRRKNVDEVKVFGDKQPEKFLPISHLERVKTVIFIYRNMSQVVSSWNRRAQNRDDRWSSHKSGLIAFIDHYFHFVSLGRLNNLVFIDYNKLIYGNYMKELNPVFSALNVSPHLFDESSFKKQFYNFHSMYAPVSPLTDDEEYIFDLLEIAKFESRLEEASKMEQYLTLFKNYSQNLFDNRKTIFTEIVSRYIKQGGKCSSDFLGRKANALAASMDVQDFAQLFSDNIDWYSTELPFLSELRSSLMKQHQ